VSKYVLLIDDDLDDAEIFFDALKKSAFLIKPPRFEDLKTKLNHLFARIW